MPDRTPIPALGARLFTFAVIADTHVTEAEGRSSSPWPVNRLANARCRSVLRDINSAAPAFVLHLGDLVHPVPAQPSFADAAQRFHELMRELDAPLYLTPGNHDVGDKALSWMPAGTVTDEYLELYGRHFGRDHFAFESNGCHFVVLNAQLINSGLDAERAQRDWLERELAAISGRRVFVGTHYAPYISDPAEPPSYDNIDEPGRSWLLRLLGMHRVEALFAGHAHNFWYDLRGTTEMYILPSTAFVRQDYSELYRIEPGAENGRDDAAKLGYMLVDVHEHGHVAHVVRSHGRQCAADHAPDSAKQPALPLVHTKTNHRAPVGLDLRHPWAETVEIAPSGGIDEFERKRVRNDYPLMAMWEMGVRMLRVPLQDLADPGVRERMRTLLRVGHRFTAYGYEIPRDDQLDALLRHHDLLHAWEMVVAWDVAPQRIAEVARIRSRCPGLRVIWSKLRRREDAAIDGMRYSHMIHHGFVTGERAQLRQLLALEGASAAIDGFALRVLRERSPWDEIRAARDIAAELTTSVSVQIRLAATEPAAVLDDELDTANRVAETVLAALATEGIDVFLDTFNDVDRSFFARTGLVDRRYNPRLPSLVYRHLHAALNRVETPPEALLAHATDSADLRVVRHGDAITTLVLPRGRHALRTLIGPASAERCTCEAVDLRSGLIVTQCTTRGDHGNHILTDAIECTHPWLISLRPN